MPAFAEPPKSVAPLVRPRPVDKPTPHLPAAFKETHADGVYEAVYHITVEASGQVRAIKVVRSLPGADDAIVDFIRANWRWEAGPAAWAFVEKLRFNLQRQP